MCRKEFSVMGMSPSPFFTNKKASGNGRVLERQLGQSDSAHTSITNTLHPWNHPVEISLTLSHFPTLFPINEYSWHCYNAFFFFNFPLLWASSSGSCNITLHQIPHPISTTKPLRNNNMKKFIEAGQNKSSKNRSLKIFAYKLWE